MKTKEEPARWWPVKRKDIGLELGNPDWTEWASAKIKYLGRKQMIIAAEALSDIQGLQVELEEVKEERDQLEKACIELANYCEHLDDDQGYTMNPGLNRKANFFLKEIGAPESTIRKVKG